MAIQFAVLIHTILALELLVDSNEQPRASWKTEWFGTLENGIMIFISMVRRDRRGPASFFNDAIDGVGNAEAGRFPIGQGAGEGNFIGDRIIHRVSLNGKLSDEKISFV